MNHFNQPLPQNPLNPQPQEQQHHHHHHHQPPQPFEIALVRKLESKTSSVRQAFLLLDVDGDGRISPTDVRTVLHNELGFDITKEQEAILFSRAASLSSRQNGKENHATTTTTTITTTTNKGMGYGDFAKYYHIVSSATYQSSQSGLAAAVGFHRNPITKNDRQSSERSIHMQPQTILRQRRTQVRQLLMSHSSRTTGSGMKNTSLFLAVDVHRSGKVTMQEFLDWLNAVAPGLQWSMEELRQVVLGEIDADGNVGLQKERLAERWFRGAKDGEGETGMTEHQFAEFIESLNAGWRTN